MKSRSFLLFFFALLALTPARAARWILYTATQTVTCAGKLNGGKLTMVGADAYCADDVGQSTTTTDSFPNGISASTMTFTTLSSGVLQVDSVGNVIVAPVSLSTAVTGSLPAASLSGTIAAARLDPSSVTMLGPSIDLGTSEAVGTLAAARFPALTGDVTTSAGFLATSIGVFSVANATSTILNATTLVNSGIVNATMSATGMAIRGTTNGTAAGQGNYGETISSITATFTSLSGSTAWGDLLAVALTTGCWTISLTIDETANGATSTDFQYGLGTTSGNNAPAAPAGSSTAFGITRFNPTTGASAATDAVGVLPAYPVCITSNTTYYLKVEGVFSVATPKASGRISGVRSN